AWLRTLADLAQAAGFASVYCLLDGLDELQETRDDPQRLFSLLRPLLDAPGMLQECGFAFRFFLPQYIEAPMHAANVGRLDRVPSHSLVWAEEDLVKMLQERLRSFSRATASSSFVRVDSFRTLCAPSYDVDRLLVARSGCAPRPMLNLARMIFEEHCRIATSEHDLIGQAAIEAALQRLDLGGAAEVGSAARSGPIVGPSEPAEREAAQEQPAPRWPPADQSAAGPADQPGAIPTLFLDARGDVWIGSRRLQLAMGGTTRRCLEILWENRSQLVRYEHMVEQLYGTDWDRRSDARASLEKLIQRLRTMLEPNSNSSNTYIKTIKGTGYVLDNYRKA
ncbi:MAG: helix-turn-helix domain-containing protein, partial [Chloroflexales bacterium]|nr:helix-turn-helix domain-containing protein [Chloroflexales bacterium]